MSCVIYNPALDIDFYKADHRRQYPEGTTEVYSNMTPRSFKRASEFCQDGMVVFGIQSFLLDYLIEEWDRGFFCLDTDWLCKPVNVLKS